MKNQSSFAGRNMRLVMLESMLTAGLLSMSIMTPFFQSIGFTQLEIAGTQTVFTLVMMVLNVPMGWIADRFSRKWANAIGDFGVALTFVGYAFAKSFWSAVTCEILLGCFMALSQGVDQGLLKHFCNQIDAREEFFRRKTATLHCLHYVSTLILVWLGGPIGAISFRLAIILSGVPYLLAGVVSLLIKDDSKKLVTQTNPLGDMLRISVASFKNHPLRVRLIAYAVGREMTHAIIWVFTPLLILVGVPMAVVSLAWALNALTCLIGAEAAKRCSIGLKDWQVFAVPLLLMMISMGVMSWNLNVITIWFYLLMGVVQGWTGSTLLPIVQRYILPEEQTTVISLAHVFSRLVYIPTSLVIGWVADRDLAKTPLMNLIIFAILSIPILLALKSKE